MNLDDIKKSKVGMGTAGISGEGRGYGFGKISEGESISLVRSAFDCGVRVFDTAPIYGFGTSEKKTWAGTLRGFREKVFVVGKTGVDWHDNGRVNMTNDPAATKKMVENTFKRVGSDYVDAILIHWLDPRVDIRRPYEVLAKYKSKGRIKYIGLSNTNTTDLTLAAEIDKVDILQGECNIFKNSFDDLQLDNHEILKMGWGTFDKGISTGRVFKGRKFDSDDCRSWAPWWKNYDFDQKYKKVNLLKEEIKKHRSGDCTENNLIEFSLKYVLSKGVHVPLVGFKNLSDMKSVLCPENNFNVESIKSIHDKL